jgi:hypothetical protein
MSKMENKVIPWDAVVDEILKRLAVPALFVVALGWVACVFYSPRRRLEVQERAALDKARIAVAGVLQKRLAHSDPELDEALNDVLSPPKRTAASSRDGEIVIDLTTTQKRSDSLEIPTNKMPPTASTVLRIEPRGGKNLVVYLRESDFETVLYPDRREFVKAVGQAWCENTGEDSHWFLPSVYIADIRTGQDLATYSCLFH